MKDNKGNKGRRALSAAAEYFDLPAQIAAGDARITLTGLRRLLIENHKGILEYSDARIAVDCGYFCVRIVGTGLGLAAMTPRELVISGDISAIELGSDGKGRRP